MKCPACKYDLKDSDGNTCPECGASIKIVASGQLKFPKLLLLGMILIVIYGLASTFDFWSEYGMFNALVMGGGSADPAELASYARLSMIFKYTTRISLGTSLICITLGHYQILRSVAAQLAARDK